MLACGGDETPIHKSCASWLTFTPVWLWQEMKMCLCSSYQWGFQWLSPGLQEWACDNCEKGHSKGWHKLLSIGFWFWSWSCRENLQYNCMIQCFKDFFSILFCAKFFSWVSFVLCIYTCMHMPDCLVCVWRITWLGGCWAVATYQAIFEGEGTDSKSTPHCFTFCLFLHSGHITVRCCIA